MDMMGEKEVSREQSQKVWREKKDLKEVDVYRSLYNRFMI